MQIRIAKCIVILLLTGVGLVGATDAFAQYGGGGEAPAPSGGAPAPQEKGETQKGKGRWSAVRSSSSGEASWTSPYVIGKRNGIRIGKANVFLVAEDYDRAEKELGKLRMGNLNPLEEATVYRLRAFIEYGRANIPAARDYLEKTIAVEDGLSPADRADIRFQIAQLWISEENWPKVIENLNKWFAMAKTPNGGAYYLLALAHYRNGDLEAALVPARQAVEVTSEPQESWMQLLLALYLTKRDYTSSIPVLEQLVQRFPKKSHWLSLSTVHGALGHYSEALVPLQLAYSQGLLDEDSDLRRLAQLLLFLELPYRAASVVEDGIAKGVIKPDAHAYELLGNSWIAAREYEKTIEPLEKAAELSEDGDLYVRLAQVHLQREKWSAATDALVKAIAKGKLERPGDAKLLMGIAFYSQEQRKQARDWFSQARLHEETSEEARTWIDHIDRELAQQAAS